MPIKILPLMLAQSCYLFSALIAISLSSIIGMKLAPHPSLATVPFGLLNLGALLSTYQLSMIMQRHGRRRGLRLGAFAGLLSASLSIAALYTQNFYVFCLACFLMGIYQASAVFYRLAAMDAASESQKGRVMGWVLSGSLIAAILGPMLSTKANEWLSQPEYLGAYLFVALFAVLALVLLGNVSHTPIRSVISGKVKTNHFLKNRAYLLGVFNTAFAQFSMMLMMLIAPLSMHAQHYSVKQSVSVIAWHLIGMFGPSFFSGKLIDRFGHRVMNLAGLAILLCSTVAAILGIVLVNYYVSLFLLGLGWNFMYMSGTTHYSQAINEDEKGKAQGLAELTIALGSVIAVLGGGVLINWFDWQQINQGLLVVLLAVATTNVMVKPKVSKN